MKYLCVVFNWFCWQVVLLFLFKRLVYIVFSLVLICYSYKIIEYICFLMEITGFSIRNQQKQIIPLDQCQKSCYLLSGSHSSIDSQLTKKLKFHLNPAWSSWGHYLIDSQLKDYEISYDSSLELLRPFFNWFLTEKWSNFRWLQLGALEAILQLILNWKTIKFQKNPPWSSWGRPLIDS